MRKSFRALLMEALRHFSEHGYVSELDLREWTQHLHVALESELPTDEESKDMLAAILGRIYARELKSGIAERVPGVSRYTIDRVAPYLRAELDRRIFAGADLIKLKRGQTIEKTIQRFSGWASSQPPAFEGMQRLSITELRRIRLGITPSVATLKFERRRCAIDQGHKLAASVAAVVAMDNNAIAAIWHDVGEDWAAYDARKEHLKRSGKLFLIRNSWAIEEGYIRRGSTMYTDQIEEPSYFVYCQCYYEYITALGRIPMEMLTAKGRAWITGLKTV